MRYVVIVLILLLSVNAYAGKFSPPPSKVSESATEGAAQIQVFNGNGAPQPFIVIGEIHAKASTEKALLNKIKSIARKEGANAILNYSIEVGNFPSYWTGATLVNGKGVAVRWAQGGEKGMTQLSAGASIPVIQ